MNSRFSVTAKNQNENWRDRNRNTSNKFFKSRVNENWRSGRTEEEFIDVHNPAQTKYFAGCKYTICPSASIVPIPSQNWLQDVPKAPKPEIRTIPKVKRQKDKSISSKNSRRKAFNVDKNNIKLQAAVSNQNKSVAKVTVRLEPEQGMDIEICAVAENKVMDCPHKDTSLMIYVSLTFLYLLLVIWMYSKIC